MIEQLDKLCRLIAQYKNYDNKTAQLCIIFCNLLCKKHTFEYVHSLHVLVNEFVSSIKTSDYDIGLEIIDLLTNIQLRFINEVRINKKHRLEIKIEYMFNNVCNAELLIMLGIPGEALNYLEKSLICFGNQSFCDKYPISEWNQTVEYKIIGAREIILKFAALEFYVMRHLGFQFSQCNFLYKEVKDLAIRGINASKEDIIFYCYYASLLSTCTVNDEKLAKDLCDILKTQFHIEIKKDELLAIEIAETLMSNFGKKMGENTNEWAERGLSIKSIDKFPQKKNYLAIVAQLGKKNLDKNLIKSYLLDYIFSLNIETKKHIRDLQKQRLSEFILLPISKAIQEKDYAFAFECAYIWITSSSDEVQVNEHEAVLLAIPNLKDYEVHYIIHFDKNTYHFKFNRKISISEFIKYKNEFEQKWNVVLESNKDNFPILTTTRDIPDCLKEVDYYQALDQFFLPSEIAEEIKKLDNINRVRFFELTNLNTPLVSLIQQHSEIDMSYFIDDGLEKSIKINKALIWCDPDMNLFDAYLESEAIGCLFINKNIEFDSFSNKECKKELFIEKYKDTTYDLIWIMCHASFDSDNPLRSRLYIEKDSFITLTELSDLMPNLSKRRLLVLNACESGIAPIRFNSMGFSGLAAGLTTRVQSVIGHFWSVDSFASAVLGSLILTHFFEGNSISVSLMMAQKNMRLGKKQIYEKLSSLSNDLQIVKSVNNRDYDWSKFIYWASPCLYE
ncbi:CHAT domain-containing protein [Clostridium sp. UBA3061]|uniref:CHAT domain-containing protein n=1 Tax=Clostridium sp. UBA3061 TaxID=1946353 RepID=UPI003216EDE3